MGYNTKDKPVLAWKPQQGKHIAKRTGKLMRDEVLERNCAVEKDRGGRLNLIHGEREINLIREGKDKKKEG